MNFHVVKTTLPQFLTETACWVVLVDLCAFGPIIWVLPPVGTVSATLSLTNSVIFTAYMAAYVRKTVSIILYCHSPFYRTKQQSSCCFSYILMRSYMMKLQDELPQNVIDFSVAVLQISSVILTCRGTSLSKFQTSWLFSIVQVVSSDLRKSEALRNSS